MLEFLPAEEDVLALKVEHKITGEDLDAILDRLEPMLEKHDKVHVFVETHSIDGIEIGGLARYGARALPLFGKLRQFGRVAVVADQGWIRSGTRIESALLPFISYNTSFLKIGSSRSPGLKVSTVCRLRTSCSDGTSNQRVRRGGSSAAGPLNHLRFT